MDRGSLRNRLFWSFALVTALAAVAPSLLARERLYQDRLELARQQALAQTRFIKTVIEDGDGALVDDARWERLLAAARGLDLRLTVTDASGRVRRDSSNDPGQLDTHEDRPEIAAASSAGEGSSVRFSATSGAEVMYAARRLDGGGVVRIGVPLADIRGGLRAELLFLSLSVAGVAGLCLLLAAFFSRRMERSMTDMAEAVASISRGRPSFRLREVPGREFAPLAMAVNQMADNIDHFVRTTDDQRAQLEIILDSMNEGVLVLGPSGNIRRWNRALETLFPAVTACEGRQCIEAVPVPELQRRLDDMLRGARVAGRAVRGGHSGPGPAEAAKRADFSERGDSSKRAEERVQTLRIELPPGRFLVIHLSRPVTPNPSLGAVAVFLDVTELTRLERVRRDFVANVSHELRTPLTAITGYAETLMRLEDGSPEQRRFAGIIHKHGGALARIVDDLLTLARLESARPPHGSFARVDGEAPSVDAAAFSDGRIGTGGRSGADDRPPADIARCADEAVSLCREAAARRGIRFAVRIAAAADIAPADSESEISELIESRLTADIAPSLLVRVVRNLAENACRYSPEGGLVEIAAARRDGEALIAVADQGPGIPAAELERVFERFYQVEKQRGSGAAGLGLAICKNIVESRGGRIHAESPCPASRYPDLLTEDAATALILSLPSGRQPS